MTDEPNYLTMPSHLATSEVMAPMVMQDEEQGIHVFIPIEEIMVEGVPGINYLLTTLQYGFYEHSGNLSLRLITTDGEEYLTLNRRSKYKLSKNCFIPSIEFLSNVDLLSVLMECSLVTDTGRIDLETKHPILRLHYLKD